LTKIQAGCFLVKNCPDGEKIGRKIARKKRAEEVAFLKKPRKKRLFPPAFAGPRGGRKKAGGN
jgi:hypothetical protein